MRGRNTRREQDAYHPDGLRTGGGIAPGGAAHARDAEARDARCGYSTDDNVQGISAGFAFHRDSGSPADAFMR